MPSLVNVLDTTIMIVLECCKCTFYIDNVRGASKKMKMWYNNDASEGVIKGFTPWFWWPVGHKSGGLMLYEKTKLPLNYMGWN